MQSSAFGPISLIGLSVAGQLDLSGASAREMTVVE
jgi:hypothetical protein